MTGIGLSPSSRAFRSRARARRLRSRPRASARARDLPATPRARDDRAEIDSRSKSILGLSSLVRLRSFVFARSSSPIFVRASRSRVRAPRGRSRPRAPPRARDLPAVPRDHSMDGPGHGPRAPTRTPPSSTHEARGPRPEPAPRSQEPPAREPTACTRSAPSRRRACPCRSRSASTWRPARGARLPACTSRAAGP